MGNLPAETTSFVGRRAELAELRKKLGEARLVSVVGPGGVGKSRLAIRIATGLGRGFPQGAWWVELAEVRDPVLVSNAVMAALDLRDQAAIEPLPLLLSYLRDKKLLLVLDNCEHLLAAAGQLVSDMLRAAPGLRVIATSREPLTVTGEHVLPLPPLDLPSAQTDATLAELGRNEAVMLFTERAAAASGAFELTSLNQAAVVNLCRRLDGLPLAIELAAVRTRVLTVDQLLDRLTDRFALLTGGSRAALPRHQTLRTTVDWSYELLAAAERELLRSLCVFAGRFTLEDVEGVRRSDHESATQGLNLLSSLVDKSLVMREDARGLACYRLHETMREYAQLKLRDAGEEAVVEERCTTYYHLKGLERLHQGRFRLLEWLAWTELEIDNIRAVLRRCLARADHPRGIDIAVSLNWFWITHATTEGLRWLDELVGLGRGSPQTQGWAYFLQGFLAVLKADPARARPPLTQAVTFARETGQLTLLSQSLSMAAVAETMAADLPSARRFLEEAGAVTQQLADVPATVALYQARSLLGFAENDLDAVTSASSEGARLSREVGDLYSLEMLLTNLGLASLIAGDLAQAKPRFMEALRIAGQIDDRVALYYLLDLLGCHAAGCGQARLAARLMGAGETIRTAVGARLIPTLPPLLAQAEAAAVASIGQPRFDAEVDAGRGLSREAALGLALGVAVGTPVSADGQAGPLGKREADVARLVAEGLSNKQIGSRLFISERTVDSHVRSILNKLGFNSRAQIAGWIASSKA